MSVVFQTRSHGNIIVIVSVELDFTGVKTIFSSSEGKALVFLQAFVWDRAVACGEDSHHFFIDFAGSLIIGHIHPADRDSFEDRGSSADMILVEMGDDQCIELLDIVRLKIGKHILRCLLVTGVDHDGHRIFFRPGLNQYAVAFSDVDQCDLEQIVSSGKLLCEQKDTAHDQCGENCKRGSFHFNDLPPVIADLFGHYITKGKEYDFFFRTVSLLSRSYRRHRAA